MNYSSIMNGLDEAVKISKGELDARKQKLSISPISEFTNVEIKNLRSNLNLTQFTFSEILGVSIKTIEAWEKGTNSPNGIARRFLGMLKEDPDLLEKYHLVKRY